MSQNKNRNVLAESEISKLKHSGKRITFGGAEGQLQRREIEEAENKKDEELQTQTVIGYSSERKSST